VHLRELNFHDMMLQQGRATALSNRVLVGGHEPTVPAVRPTSVRDDELWREASQLKKVYGEKRDALVSLLSSQLAFLKTEAQVPA